MTDKLTVIDQREVTFYDDELTAVRADDGRVYVAVRRMCDALGVDRRGQMRRIRDNPILSEGYKRGGLISTPSVGGRGGGQQEATFLRVDLVPLWLSGISPNRVKAEIQQKLMRFQREAANVLWEAFQEGRLTVDPDFDTLLQQASQDTLEAYQVALAMVKLARNQIMLEARIVHHDERLDDHDQQLTDYGRRLETIEADLGQEDRYITESQATQISQAIRAIALHMSKKSKQNEYGRCWGEFYRKWGVSKYRHLPAARFDEAMDWLSNWHHDLTGEAF